MVIIWIQQMDNPEKWNILFPLLKQKQSQEIIQAISGHFNKKTGVAQPLLLACLKQKINIETQYAVINVFVHTLGNETITNLKN